MIVLYLFFSLKLETNIDSLQTSIRQNPQLPVVLELNRCYLRMGKYNEGINLLKDYERHFKSEKKSILIFNIGDDYLFAGMILPARNEYLKLVNRYPRSEIANDALERLYLIESTRQDTILLKKLARSICLFKSEQFDSAEDSLKDLLKTKIGAYAYYYLACLYKEKEDLPMALSALNELGNSYPDHKIHNAILLLAEIHLRSNNEKKAQDILEDLIIKKPNSIYAVRAREMLKTLGAGLDF